MKQPINILLGLALILPLLSFKPVNDITSIQWISEEYKDLETGDLIQMTNEFECTPEGLSWSLFGGALPVSEVEWSLDENEVGYIRYQMADADLTGTITFYLGATLRAETNLKSDVGQLRFQFHFNEEQQVFSNIETHNSPSENN